MHEVMGGGYIFGQLAWAVPDVPDEPGVPAAGTEVLGVGVLVEPVVAAFAAAAPPTISAPETATIAAALRIGLMLLTSSWRLVGYNQ